MAKDYDSQDNSGDKEAKDNEAKDNSKDNGSSFGKCLANNVIGAMEQANNNCPVTDSDCKTWEASHYLAEKCIGERDTSGNDSGGSGSGGECIIF